jgi:hypothetical protein
VDLGSGSSVPFCPKHGLMVCPLCGSVLVEVAYRGNKPKFLALAKRDGFRCFVGCLRVDLHNKIVDGVDFRGKVFIKPIFEDDVQLAV